MIKPTGPTDKPADAIAPIPPEGIVLGAGRLRVSQQDLDMYAALVGVPQSLLLSDEPPVTAPSSRLDATSLSVWVRGISRRAKDQIRHQIHQATARLTSTGRTPRA